MSATPSDMNLKFDSVSSSMPGSTVKATAMRRQVAVPEDEWITLCFRQWSFHGDAVRYERVQELRARAVSGGVIVEHSHLYVFFALYVLTTM